LTKAFLASEVADVAVSGPVSAIPQKADMDQYDCDVRFVPKADICTAANSVFSLENFVHLRQQCR